MFVAGTVPDTTTPAARPIAINRTEGNSNLGISVLIGDATTIFIAGIALNCAVGHREHAGLEIEDATTAGIACAEIARNGAVDKCEGGD